MHLSDVAWRRAMNSLVGGVNSPVRAFRAVETQPLVAARGEGPYLYDLDGNRYVDLLMSWGAIVLGHGDPEVRRAIEVAAADGTGFGLTTLAETELAELIRSAFPSVELLRLVNSGTEAVMSAVRLARGYTGRDKILVFSGCYHGHSDGLLVQGGSGLSTLGIPRSAGVPEGVAAETVVGIYNDEDSVDEACAAHSDELAAIIVEPVAGNMGVIPPGRGFLEHLRQAADRVGALLIFDEVITGFRVAPGGAQERYGVRPDITTLGKIMGGGLPVGAFGGRREVMERLAPLGDVYQAGTLAGNPLVARAGAAVLRTLLSRQPYDRIECLAKELCDGVHAAAERAGVPMHIGRVGGMFTFFFTDHPVHDHASALRCDTARYARFFRAMLERGVLLPPSQFEACFLSCAHTSREVERVILAASEALALLAAQRRGRRATTRR